MKLSAFRLLLCLLAGAYLLFPPETRSQTRSIRLRAETIRTTPAQYDTAADRSAPEQPVRGLYLIQFTGPVQPEWRRQLETLGADFVQFVPEDAFIVQLKDVSPGQIRRQPFVHWLGKYKADYKLHEAVRAQSALSLKPASRIPVRVLVAAHSDASELAAARGLLVNEHEGTRLRMGTIISGLIDPASIDSLAASEAVLWIEPAPRMELFDEEASKIIGGDDGLRSTPTLTQKLGYNGSGVSVAVADSGLDTGDKSTMHPDLAGRVDALLFYGTLSDASDEHSHGTHVAGIIAGNAAVGETDANGALYGLGVASGAHIVAQRIFDGEGGYTYPDSSFEPLTRDAVSAGADIGSNSWGDDTQGRYDLSAAEFDALVRDADSVTPGDQPYILEFSAGNAGPGAQTIGSPAVAKNVIATGATENNRFDLPLPEFSIYASGQETMADFSSRGPCEDGRIKPDVVAPGTWIASLRSEYANDDYAWWPISDNYMYQGGTSQAGPGVSGAAAVFVQYYRSLNGGETPSPALVKAALVNSAVDMDGDLGDTGPAPNMDEGWGRVDLTKLIGSTLQHEFVNQTQPLTNSQVYERRIVVADATAPLKVTLTYTDVPGIPAAIPALVNDLDLEVVGPDGQLYRGNYFDNGNSTRGAVSGDRINNVEGVRFRTPRIGQYVVRVRAHSIAEDAVRLTPDTIDQDFALAISGDLLAPGASLVAVDKNAYTAPSTIHLTVIDPDRAGAASVSAALTSTTEPTAENAVLLADGSTGVFTGVVATAIGGGIPDGQLQISDGDVIQVDYFDASAGLARTVTARGDLVAPMLTNVSPSSAFGTVTISWDSDEPATSIVRYGTNGVLASAVTNLALVTEHTIELKGLVSEANYSFHVSGADEAGNTSTNDSGVALFSFLAPTTATVLFVDGYVAFELDETFIPRSAYTNALEQTGVSYEVWDVSELGSPTASDLAPYRVVIWRLSSSLYWYFYGYPGLTAAEQSALATYLANDGAVFLSSMELLTQLGTSASAQDFRSNVLHVVEFTEDSGVSQADGVTNDPLSGGMALPLDYSAYDDSFFMWDPNVSDTLTVRDDAIPIFTDAGFGDIAGLRYPSVGQDSTGRVVFLSFPFDAVSATDPAPNNRATLMRNILNFLAPGVNGAGSLALDRSAYSIPGLVTVEMADSDLEGSGASSVTFYSSSDPTGVTITVNETVKPGLFRGTLTLVSTNSTPKPNELRAAEGDTLIAEYFDASNGGVVQATATVDTIAPVLTGVAVEPGYQDAIVTWQTTEPSDSLVQFFESPALERTAHNPAITTDHEVYVTGLLPSRTYTFQTTSRDLAGNAGTLATNAAGLPLMFTTLTPIPLPWFDDLETGGTLWEVRPEDYTELNWTLGPPNNSLESAAHSPVNAWGSNLNGVQKDLIESTLISPAIDLTSVSSAELRFWHSHDFSVDISEAFEVALLEIYTDLDGEPLTYFEYAGSSEGWKEEVVNLTPYVGQVIYLAWHYAYFRTTFDPLDSPGWLVDDVRVTADLAEAGTITVTNNLAQSTFTIKGPKTLSGTGPVMTATNVAPGEYSITYNPVPYFITPSSETNTLTPGGVLSFTNSYTIVDTNLNGIADGWEVSFLGGAGMTNAYTNDADQDGSSDGDEFMAGTNPTNATSILHADIKPQPNNLMRLEWPTMPGRSYRLVGTSDLISWQVEMDWRRAAGSTMSYLLTPGHVTFYRVEVQP